MYLGIILAQRMFHLCECTMCAWKKSTFCSCWMDHSLLYMSIRSKFLNDFIQIIYGFTKFLSTYSVNCWNMYVTVSYYPSICLWIFASYIDTLRLCYYLTCIYEWMFPFIIIKYPSLSLVTLFVLKPTLSNIQKTFLVFLGLWFSWYILLHPFISIYLCI